MIFIDFETRSQVDLKQVGAWKYSKHPSTQILCLSYNLTHNPKDTKLWYPKDLFPHLDYPCNSLNPLFIYIAEAKKNNSLLIEAHNAFFEICIWNNIFAPQQGIEPIEVKNWACSLARASMASLPRELRAAGEALRLDTVKSKEGKSQMLRCSKPVNPSKTLRKELKSKPTHKLIYNNSHLYWDGKYLFDESINRLTDTFDYCKNDVNAEMALSDVLPELPERERQIWISTQKHNLKGVKFNRNLAETCIRKSDEYKKILNKRIQEITNNEIDAGTKRKQIANWLESNTGLKLPNTQAATLDHYLETQSLAPLEREVISIIKNVNRTSIRKYNSILGKTDSEGIARDLLMYHGAGTGRYSGKGIQVQNFPRGADIKDMDIAVSDAINLSVSEIEEKYGNPLEFFSNISRGSVVPRENKLLLFADYSAIEARILLWLAEEKEAMDLIRRGEDIYCDMASIIYRRTITKNDFNERQFGKQTILGSGYGMGFIKFLLLCRQYGISFTKDQIQNILTPSEYKKALRTVEWLLCLGSCKGRLDADTNETWRFRKQFAVKARKTLLDNMLMLDDVLHELVLMKHVNTLYRNRYTNVTAYWKMQEEKAKEALRNPYKVIDTVKGIRWEFDPVEDFLYCHLPSERAIHYYEPKLSKSGQISYKTLNAQGQFVRTSTYGGKITENQDQALARDIMVHAQLNIDRNHPDWSILMSIHDELGAEVDEFFEDFDLFERVLCDLPPFMEGCLIAAESKMMACYRKA